VQEPIKPPIITPSSVREIAWGFAAPLLLATAIELGLFDLLSDHALDLGQIADRTNLSPRGLRALLYPLVGLGFVGLDAAGRFHLSAATRVLLVPSKPSFQGHVLRRTSERIQPWLLLADAVRRGGPENDSTNILSASDYRQFVGELFAMNYPSAVTLAQKMLADRRGEAIRLLDVGAGSGVWGIAFAKASNTVHVTAVDLPEVLPITKAYAYSNGVLQRFDFLSGDIHKTDYGHHRFQIAVLGHVIHGEGREKGCVLLERLYQALEPGGTIVVAEFLVDDDRRGPLAHLFFAVSMLLQTRDGDTFSFSEIASWLKDAGFKDARMVSVPGPSPLIVARK
jgi:3-hydroxy-5-methyl-1-naphthoate 3-O-methyltransferase